MSARRTPRHTPLLLWLSTAFFVACSGGASCGGCSCLQPIPGGYTGKKLDNAVVARVTNDGFTFVSQNYASLLQQAGMTNPLQVGVPCSNVSFGSDGHLCDQNRNNNCDTGEQCNITVDIRNLNIAPADGPGANTGLLRASAQLQIATGDMWMRTCAASLFGACICRLTCAANFQSTRSGAQNDTFTADVNFTIDPAWGRILAFDVANIGGINSLEGGDLDVRTSGVCSAIACSVLDVGFIKTFVMDQFVKPQLMNQVRSAVDDARCRACGATEPCPTGATCTGGRCMAGGRCVPVTLGMEGRMDLAAASLGGLSLSGGLDMYAVAGGTVSSQANQHFTAGLLGGGEPFTGYAADGGTLRGPVPCVPAVDPPLDVTIPPADWASVSVDGGYHVGLAVGAKYLRQVTWAAHQAGAMCLDVGTSQVGLINTGLFKTFLPSLGKLATRDGNDAPMIVALRPRTPPVLTIGEGTFDPVTKQPIKPLIKLDWKDLDIDIYAMLDERYVRLFRLTADVAIPLSLVFEGCDKVTPALGDIKSLITNVRAANSELLAEDPQVLADLIPSLLTLAESSLAGALGAQTLPSVGNFKLKVNEARGITAVPGGVEFEHLGLFASLMLSNASCAVAAPKTVASLKRAEIPAASELRATGRGLRQPTAILDVAALGATGPVEYAVRIDGGLWSTFGPARANELSVSHPAFLFQGKHRIEVRSRLVSEPHAVSLPTTVDFLVDYDGPSVTLTVDRRANRLLVRAHDAVTPDTELRYAYRVGEGEASAWGPPREIDLLAVEAQGGVTVLVKDAAGFVGEAAHKVPRVASRPDAVDEPGAAPRSGCGATGGASALALLWLAVLGLRRAPSPREARSGLG